MRRWMIAVLLIMCILSVTTAQNDTPTGTPVEVTASNDGADRQQFAPKT